MQDDIATSAASIAAAGVTSAEEVRRQPRALVCYSAERLAGNRALRRFLYANRYCHPDVAAVNQRACNLLRDVFLAYLEKPERLGKTTARRIENEGLHRTVCDYLSGMTDRYLLEEHAWLFGESIAAAPHSPLRCSASGGAALSAEHGRPARRAPRLAGH